MASKWPCCRSSTALRRQPLAPDPRSTVFTAQLSQPLHKYRCVQTKHSRPVPYSLVSRLSVRLIADTEVELLIHKLAQIPDRKRPEHFEGGYYSTINWLHAYADWVRAARWPANAGNVMLLAPACRRGDRQPSHSAFNEIQANCTCVPCSAWPKSSRFPH